MKQRRESPLCPVFAGYVARTIESTEYSDRRAKCASLAMDAARRLDFGRLVKMVGHIAWYEGDGRLAAELLGSCEARRLFGDHDEVTPLPVYMGPLNADIGAAVAQIDEYLEVA